MLRTISIVVATLRQQRAVQTSPTFERSLPLLVVSNHASQHGWAQNWAQEFFGAANHSAISTFRDVPSLPSAQGVAGSNPVAPTNKAQKNRRILGQIVTRSGLSAPGLFCRYAARLAARR